jgi:hypothetical protein
MSLNANIDNPTAERFKKVRRYKCALFSEKAA